MSNTSVGLRAAMSASSELLATDWLVRLLKHFSVQQLDAISSQELTTHLSISADSISDVSAVACAEDTLHGSAEQIKDRAGADDLAAELKRRVMRLAGAKLDDVFVSMAAHVVEEAAVETLSLAVEGRSLQGVRYKGQVYRKVDVFKPCHRLQAYCLAQTLSEQQATYLITRSETRFAVWAHYALPSRLSP